MITSNEAELIQYINLLSNNLKLEDARRWKQKCFNEKLIIPVVFMFPFDEEQPVSIQNISNN